MTNRTHGLPLGGAFAVNSSIKTLLVLLFLCPSSLALAADSEESCSSVDFRSQLPPVRNQRDSSLCFAYTSADLMSQRMGKSVSAAYVAANYALANSSRLAESRAPELRSHLESYDWRQRVDTARLSSSFYDRDGECLEGDEQDRVGILGIDGGEEDVAVLLANVDGVCLENDFPSTGPMGFSKRDLAAASRRPDAQARRYLQDARCGLKPAAQPLFSQNFMGDFFSTIEARQSAWISDTLQGRWLRRRCQAIRPEQPFIPEIEMLPTNRVNEISKGKMGLEPAERNRLFASLDGALKSGKIAAIGYNSSIIEKPEGPSTECNKHSAHSSVIVARRFDRRRGVCEYLIRNSWGAKCDGYRRDASVYCDRRDPGNIWISSEELAKTLFSVVQLK
jgi:hypothetical protein